MLQAIIDAFKPFISFGGTLGQRNLDQGDSSQRDGHFFALAGLLKAPKDFMGRDLSQGWQETVKLHEARPGLYRRSPNPAVWEYNPNNFSRDQHGMLRIAMAVMGDKKRIAQSAWAMLKRLGFHQNYHIGTDTTGQWWHDYHIPDIMTPGEIAVIVRGLNAWYLYPLLLVLDLSLVIDLLLRKDDNWDSDNMMAMNLLYAYKKYRTPWSWLVMKKYKKTNFMDRIYNYYSCEDDRNGLAPMADLFKLAYEELT